MIETPPTIDGSSAVFTLITGEKVRVSLCETGLGNFGYAMKIYADKTLLVKPDASNAIELYTPKSLEAERVENERIVAQRGAS